MALPESDAEMLLLHNPRCSKSRATLALLEERSGGSLVVTLGRRTAYCARTKMESACLTAPLDATRDRQERRDSVSLER
jgi:hypothetical protein